VDIRRVRVKRRPAVFYAIGGAAVLLATLGLSRLRPAGPTFESATLYTDTVRRGTMVRQVRGSGALVPESLRIVSAMTAGRVDRILARPGTHVDAGTLLLELSNPDVQLEGLDAERQVKLAEANLADLSASLEGQRLGAVSVVASVKNELQEAERGVKVADRLSSEGLGSAMDADRARDALEQTRLRYESEQQRLSVLTESAHSSVALRRAEIGRLHAIAEFQRARVGSMQVRAGARGVVQSLALEPGQWVNPGQELARVAGEGRLKAVIRVPENDARDLGPGLHATVDTRDGIIPAHVIRMDPGSQNGSVGIDLGLDGPLPRGARPDLSVDGVIEIDALRNVLYLARPAEGSSDATVRLFRIARGGRSAERVAVRLGRASYQSVEIVTGLNEGDRMILTDMSQVRSDRVNLK
jgi:HlyD family secretion protein